MWSQLKIDIDSLRTQEHRTVLAVKGSHGTWWAALLLMYDWSQLVRPGLLPRHDESPLIRTTYTETLHIMHKRHMEVLACLLLADAAVTWWLHGWRKEPLSVGTDRCQRMWQARLWSRCETFLDSGGSRDFKVVWRQKKTILPFHFSSISLLIAPSMYLSPFLSFSEPSVKIARNSSWCYLIRLE